MSEKPDVSASALKCLTKMRDAYDNERYEDAELVCEGRSTWLGEDKVQRRVVDELLSLVAIKDTNESEKISRFIINGVGRAIVDNPDIARQVRIALKTGGPFTIHNGKVEPITALKLSP